MSRPTYRVRLGRMLGEKLKRIGVGPASNYGAIAMIPGGGLGAYFVWVVGEVEVIGFSPVPDILARGAKFRTVPVNRTCQQIEVYAK